MNQRLARPTAYLLFFLGFGATASAQRLAPPDEKPPVDAIVIEAHPTGFNHGMYKELSGTWTDTLGVTGSGITAGIARKLTTTGDKMSGMVEFRPVIPEDGLWRVDILWPETSNAKGVAFVPKGLGEQEPIRLSLRPAGVADSEAGKWMILGNYDLKKGNTFSLVMDLTQALGAFDAGKPAEGSIQAARFIPVEKQAANYDPQNPFGVPVFRATGGGDNPFGNGSTAAANTGGANPFEAPAAAPVVSTPAPPPPADDDPFAAAGTPAPPATKPADPFEVPADTPAATTAAQKSPDDFDPFADPGAAAASATKTAAATGTAKVEDPFAAMANDGNAPIVPAPKDDDPFAAIDAASAGRATGTPAPPSGGTANPFEMANAPAAATPVPRPGSAQAPRATPTPAGGVVGENPFAPVVPAGGRTDSAPAALEPVGTPAAPVATPAAATPASTFVPVTAPQATPPPPPAGIEFEPSLDAALAKAGKRDLSIVLVFVSDTAASTRFEANVLSHPDVAAALSRMVAVRVNLRDDKALADRFAVRKAPYAVVLDSLGHAKAHVSEASSGPRLARELRKAAQ